MIHSDQSSPKSHRRKPKKIACILDFGFKTRQCETLEEHMQSLPPEVKKFYELHTPAKMEGLLRAIRGYIGSGMEVEQQVHIAKDNNTMTRAVLRLAGKTIDR